MKKPILIYCFIAFIITWIIAFSIYISYRNSNITAFQLNLYHSFAAIGPFLGAIFTTHYFYGKTGIKRLFYKLNLNFPIRKTILLIISPLGFFILGVLVNKLIKNEWFDFQLFFQSYLNSKANLIVWILPIFSYAIFEEIGWRGFLLPHLQERYNAWKSTIYLTIIWALWHLPFFFYRFDFSILLSIGFLFGIFMGSIILTSIYNSSKGYLIPVILFHFFNNLSSMFDKQLIASILSIGFVFIAVYIYLKFGKENLSQTKRTRVYFKNNDV